MSAHILDEDAWPDDETGVYKDASGKPLVLSEAELAALGGDVISAGWYAAEYPDEGCEVRVVVSRLEGKHRREYTFTLSGSSVSEERPHVSVMVMFANKKRHDGMYYYYAFDLILEDGVWKMEDSLAIEPPTRVDQENLKHLKEKMMGCLCYLIAEFIGYIL